MRLNTQTIMRHFTLVELLVVIAIVAIILSILVSGCSMIFSYGTSDGHRDGYIQKASTKNGFLFSSHEVDMAVPGFGGSSEGKKGEAGFGNVFSFSVSDEKVWEQINNLNAKQFVRVYYHEDRWAPKHWTNYLATEVKILDADK
jgi:prepilin-type N-terminal cleavage/methylation domain-containing protein